MVQHLFCRPAGVILLGAMRGAGKVMPASI
jgi:hypothetical protein